MVGVRTLLPLIIASAAFVGCGSVDTPPLGGAYGGTTNATDPNGGSNGDDGDAGTGTNDGSVVQQGQDSGSQQKDSGTVTKDSGGPPPVDSGGSTAPTWSELFTSYLASGTEGRCDSCHSEGSSASSLYTWLKGKGYINGTSSKLTSSSQSILSWYGGSMPPSGPSDATAVSQMDAWVAAGAADN
jgi:hypothetical protein